MRYRTDIDGLRAIAVLLVVFSHFEFDFVSGGFIGVDVFFVISGYLITGIIKERVADGSFSFGWFYVRRIKRLMPVLFFVIGATSLAAFFLLLPQDLVTFSKSIVFVVLNLGNFFFWREHGGYFGGVAQEAPLLHTWSLAVEEQYYLIWPLMLVLLFRFVPRRALPALLAAATLALLAFSEFVTQRTFGAAYYLLPTRFFELMAGSALALLWSGSSRPGSSGADILAPLGLLIVLCSAVLLTENSSFPGVNAAYPVLGTLLLIRYPSNSLAPILTSRFMQLTGKISYSMYLWHWPLIVFVKYHELEVTLALQGALLTIAYLLSYGSWRYVENPARRSRNTAFPSVARRLYVFPATLLCILAVAGIWGQGFPDRFPAIAGSMGELQRQSTAELGWACHHSSRERKVPPSFACSKAAPGGSEDGERTALLIGDSHANHFLPFVEALAERRGIRVVNYTMDQCPPVLGVRSGTSEFRATECRKRNDAAYEFIRASDFDFVFLGAFWPSKPTGDAGGAADVGSATRDGFVDGLKNSVDAITSAGGKAFIIEHMYTLEGRSPKCPVKQAAFGKDLDCKVEEPAPSDYVQQVIREAAIDAELIRTRELVCDETGCPIAHEGVPMFRDDNHLTVAGSRLLAREFAARHDLDALFD